jgi:hypothetical protein
MEVPSGDKDLTSIGKIDIILSLGKENVQGKLSPPGDKIG